MGNNNTEKPFILLMGEMKEEISQVVNKYMPVMPSDIIADYLVILTNSLRQNGQNQLQEAIQLYQQQQTPEQEVVEDDNTTEVSTQDELRDTEINE